jgi:hypothetical protein
MARVASAEMDFEVSKLTVTPIGGGDVKVEFSFDYAWDGPADFSVPVIVTQNEVPEEHPVVIVESIDNPCPTTGTCPSQACGTISWSYKTLSGSQPMKCKKVGEACECKPVGTIRPSKVVPQDHSTDQITFVVEIDPFNEFMEDDETNNIVTLVYKAPGGTPR